VVRFTARRTSAPTRVRPRCRVVAAWAVTVRSAAVVTVVVPVATVASAVVLEEEIVVEVIAVETVATTKSHAATEA